MRETIIVAGSLAQRPHYGGHTWVFLQYLLGFQRLGWEVLFVDRLEPGMCVDRAGNPAPFESSVNLHYITEVMQRFGLDGRWSVLYDGGREVAGCAREDVVERARRSALLVNVMGFLDDEEILSAAPLRAFLDIDPGFGQMWQDLGLHQLFGGHDQYVTDRAVGLVLVFVFVLMILYGLPPIERSQPPVAAFHRAAFTSVVTRSIT